MSRLWDNEEAHGRVFYSETSVRVDHVLFLLEVRIKNKEVVKMLYVTRIEVKSNVTYERYFKKVVYKHM